MLTDNCTCLATLKCSFLYWLMLIVLCVFQTAELPPIKNITDAYVLLNLGDSVTTDHISPAGSIARNSAAARYLAGRGLVFFSCIY